MPLSYYSNYGTLQQHLNPEMSFFTQAQPDLTPNLLAFHDNFAISGTCVGPLFDPDELLYPYMSSPSQHSNSLIPVLFAPLELEPYHYAKHAKTCQDVFVPNPQVQPEFSPELIVPSWEFESIMPVYYGGGSVVDHESTAVKEGNGGGTLSVQSMAARKRRRKTTEETQELGKLIAGGLKLKAAEMFQAASKYINFLQAQVGILELMSPKQ